MELLIVLPFLGTFFINLRKRLHISVSKTLPQCNILCSNCNITYYGESEHYLKVRVGEHISKSALKGKRVNNNKKICC